MYVHMFIHIHSLKIEKILLLWNIYFSKEYFVNNAYVLFYNLLILILILTLKSEKYNFLRNN